jgi:hypothetical protein
VKTVYFLLILENQFVLIPILPTYRHIKQAIYSGFSDFSDFSDNNDFSGIPFLEFRIDKVGNLFPQKLWRKVAYLASLKLHQMNRRK